MADVLIVCVREDEAQAKSLADMFERAGFTVGGAPSSEAALRSCGATVVMWSQASIRSRPFLDASQRAVNAGKAILACLIDPPPGDSVGDAPAFDLGDWDGDPEDPCLDPLFFAVDRMVAVLRADAGGDDYDAPAPTRHERAPPRDKRPAAAPSYTRAPYEAPRHEAPPSRDTARAATPTPSYQSRGRAPAPPARPEPRHEPRAAAPLPRTDAYTPPHNPIGSEAEHWRAIRHSRDPADFLDFLAKYGADGDFSELADIRLKELQGRAAPPAREAPRPLPTTPPRRTEHNFEQPPRAREPERTRSREPERARDVERDRPIPAAFERTERVRAPSGVRDGGGSGGGIARALFAVVLLGGAALAGGLYFGLNQQLPSEVSDNADSNTLADQHSPSAPAPAPEEPVSYEEAALDPPPQIETAREAPRGGPNLPRTPATRETSPREPDRDVNAAAISGPVPLTPAPATPSPVVFVEPLPVASVAPQPAQAPRPAGRISWAAQPSAQRIAALYPDRAMRLGRGGSARLDCGVRPDFGLSCTIASESPQGAGFGQAALRAATYFRVNANLSNGESAVGSRTNVTIRFQGS